MYNATLLHDSFRRSGTAHRTLTRAPLVPSQDVSRYQARDMPAPTYDLDQKTPELLHSILLPALAVAITGGGIVLIQQIGAWLAH
jgi:hypothetical protein